jgi:hypothetical protein
MPFTGVSRHQDGAAMSRRKYTRKAISLLAGLAIAAMIPLSIRADDGQSRDHEQTFTVDVALDGATVIVNHVDPTQPPKVAFPGDILVIRGTIYPGHTLPSGIVNNDPNAPGGIGKILCRALILVQPTDLTTPAASFVTELYSFWNDSQTIIADGSGANLYATVLRAVLGGTGHFESVTGEIIEKNIGLNSTGFCNLRITFKLKRSRGERHGNSEQFQ